MLAEQCALNRKSVIIIIVIIILFKYPWLYSSQGLKAKKLKSKLERLSVRNVVDDEGVVQQNGVKTLQRRHRKTLKQK